MRSRPFTAPKNDIITNYYISDYGTFYYVTNEQNDFEENSLANINGGGIISYNNTENSKHGRSNAKISFNQIKNILMKKGKTEINQIDFKAFTTGKSITKNHKEILFYCRVK